MKTLSPMTAGEQFPGLYRRTALPLFQRQRSVPVRVSSECRKVSHAPKMMSLSVTDGAA